MAPDWYEPEKPKKHKASVTLTKDLEKKKKKKKAAHVVADDDDMLGATIPTGR